MALSQQAVSMNPETVVELVEERLVVKLLVAVVVDDDMNVQQPQPAIFLLLAFEVPMMPLYVLVSVAICGLYVAAWTMPSVKQSFCLVSCSVIEMLIVQSGLTVPVTV